MKEAFISATGLVLEVGVGVATIFLFKLAIVSKSALGRFAQGLNSKTQGITNSAKEFGESRQFYQNRQMARDQRKQERRRANVSSYAETVSGDGWRSRALRRRAAGGIAGQVIGAASGGRRELNQAGQERQYVSGVSQLGKLEHEEASQGATLIEHAKVTSPGQLAEIAAGRAATGISGQTISGANNRALQTAAIQKIINAQDAGAIESMFMDSAVDKNMLVGELQKEQNYSTSKGAGAHFVSMQPMTYTRPQINEQAVSSMSNIAAEKLATQDGPAWASARAGYDASQGTLAQRQKLWDQVKEIESNDQIRNKLKPSAQEHFDQIRGTLRPT